MEIYAKRFTKASLIYLGIGVLLGISMAVCPEGIARLRFVHVHLNLLGFMTMMVASVAYHVLPRFNSNPLPWPGGVRYHFYLHNIGLAGMIACHLLGGVWTGGAIHAALVLFALLTGAGIFIMIYNLYGVLNVES